MILSCDYRQFASRRGDESNHIWTARGEIAQIDEALGPLMRKV